MPDTPSTARIPFITFIPVVCHCILEHRKPLGGSLVHPFFAVTESCFSLEVHHGSAPTHWSLLKATVLATTFSSPLQCQPPTTYNQVYSLSILVIFLSDAHHLDCVDHRCNPIYLVSLCTFVILATNSFPYSSGGSSLLTIPVL